MPKAARVGDKTSHDGTLAVPSQAALAMKIATVLIEGRPAAVMGCVHVCTQGPHIRLATANVLLPRPGPPPTVFVGGAPAAVVGDRSVCQATIRFGATTVEIGGGR
ncbi:hypothetical protein GCM10022243_01020 [Saccharothrix violaceirubra]|uniref:Putative Zn-binding protein involved in type VI secretion n=1 Tax=Saccharothrix violaceirubra TaxID=413306 RepID=A0A7W7WVY5_9PSEU|nr:PAAR domain-containing protein [Saccharothrix violaceirubra]MBB4965402.1 putative Zn-binding protein involved in type VI secretion [Saccharothrix violaceirubra]